MNPDRLSKFPVSSDGKLMPAMLRVTISRDKVIPEDYEHLIPSKTTVISSLLNTSLPTILSVASLLQPAGSCVVYEEPS